MGGVGKFGSVWELYIPRSGVVRSAVGSLVICRGFVDRIRQRKKRETDVVVTTGERPQELENGDVWRLAAGEQEQKINTP